ncbi:phospho-acceptor domain-containing protein [Neobacillus bataviensis]|uniref:histidine kinase n=1 Tax=Neobacillus bataviensis TaxID=220685 RepID=A0A561CX51_9BACI|nr:HAMP domain-containing histidine kinase [Neobacillus bataviensis]TWD95813.1 phospho-acceptor domain-containing protein [Neobacillus bataviensis]
MKHKFFSFVGPLFNRFDKDVFNNTQNRLTRNFSGLLMLFLFLFVLIVYSVLYFVILNTQERELQTLVAQESNYIENLLGNNGQSGLRGIQNQEVIFSGVNQSFYYVLNTNGEVVFGSEANPRLRPEFLSLVNKHMTNHQEIQKEIISMNNKLRKGRGEFRTPDENQDIHMMIASHEVYYKGQYMGQIYVGKDVSFAYRLFHWILVILIVLGIVFVGVAIYISLRMSKRAMVPIRAAFKRQREFVGDASHELRTPLSVLLSSVDAMDMTIEKDEMSVKLLANMREEVKRMTNLVSDLLTLARSDSNTIELKTEVFDLRPLSEKAIESLQPIAASKQIQLELSAPTDCIVLGDPQRLSQLIYILLDNAIKYTPNGGEVKLTLLKEGNEIGIFVQDTGIGIKKEDYQRIFERFYRTDKSRSRQIGGYGLGLSIAKWIVETHKGTIQVSSQIGKGSTFIVKLPDYVS